MHKASTLQSVHYTATIDCGFCWCFSFEGSHSQLVYPLLEIIHYILVMYNNNRTTIVWQVLFCQFAEDLTFYWSHRLFHSPAVYKKIHKVHHEFTAPFGWYDDRRYYKKILKRYLKILLYIAGQQSMHIL